MTLNRIILLLALLHLQGLLYGVRSTEYGVRSTEYGVRSTEYGVRSTEYGVRSFLFFFLRIFLLLAYKALSTAAYNSFFFIINLYTAFMK